MSAHFWLNWPRSWARKCRTRIAKSRVRCWFVRRVKIIRNTMRPSNGVSTESMGSQLAWYSRVFCVSDLPVVTCEWLQMCYKNEKRLPLKAFLVGDSISPVDDIPDTEFMQNEPEPEPEPMEDVIEQVPQGMQIAGELEIKSQIDCKKIAINRIKICRTKGGTPVNPRVSSLRPSVAAQRAQISPTTPGYAARDDSMSSFETPEDDYARKSDTDNPGTKRYRSENGVFRTPEYASSPFLLAQTRAFCEERRNRNKATESEKKNKKKSMVSSELAFPRSMHLDLEGYVHWNFPRRHGLNANVAFGRKPLVMPTKVQVNVSRPTRRRSAKLTPQMPPMPVLPVQVANWRTTQRMPITKPMSTFANWMLSYRIEIMWLKLRKLYQIRPHVCMNWVSQTLSAFARNILFF